MAERRPATECWRRLRTVGMGKQPDSRFDGARHAPSKLTTIGSRKMLAGGCRLRATATRRTEDDATVSTPDLGEG